MRMHFRLLGKILVVTIFSFGCFLSYTSLPFGQIFLALTTAPVKRGELNRRLYRIGLLFWGRFVLVLFFTGFISLILAESVYGSISIINDCGKYPRMLHTTSGLRLAFLFSSSLASSGSLSKSIRGNVQLIIYQ